MKHTRSQVEDQKVVVIGTKTWAQLLRSEVRPTEEFTPDHKTLDEIRAELKAAGMPSGRCYVQRWLSQAIAKGTVSRLEGHLPDSNGRLRRVAKYLVK